MEKRWYVFMAILLAITIIGCFVPAQPEIWTLSDNVNLADVAWLLTATIFVLMMTPGLSLFYGGMVRKK
ncbi:MAG: ammonium transporter, partial [Bacteroidales bacterium]|nr:ammonium transporter [Bacteroidales bacterium]